MNDRQMAAKIKQIHEGWKPGSFGFHELLDRLYLFADGFSQSVADHPVANHPKLRKKIKKVERLLFDLYQEAGNCQLLDDRLLVLRMFFIPMLNFNTGLYEFRCKLCGTVVKNIYDLSGHKPDCALCNVFGDEIRRWHERK